jgi:hypothetical protein
MKRKFEAAGRDCHHEDISEIEDKVSKLLITILFVYRSVGYLFYASPHPPVTC